MLQSGAHVYFLSFLEAFKTYRMSTQSNLNTVLVYYTDINLIFTADSYKNTSVSESPLLCDTEV